MILESIQFSNVYKISDLQTKLDSGFFDEFLTDFSLYVMTEKGIVKINQDKTIEYNVSVDLNNYIKNTDYASTTKPGIIKIANYTSTGISLDGDKYLKIAKASDATIDDKENVFMPIVPSNLNYAVKSALSGEKNINDMTDDEKTKARSVIDAISSTDLNDYVKNNDYASQTKGGVVKVHSGYGFNIGELGTLMINKANKIMIDSKSNEYNPIVPSNLNYAVRSVYPEIKTSIDDITINTIYDLGEQSNLSITLPTSGNIGDWIQFDFLSGSTKTTLDITCDSGILGFDLIPELNYIYTMYLDWGMIGKNTDNTIIYGWRFNYSEYPLNS